MVVGVEKSQGPVAILDAIISKDYHSCVFEA